jgi:hypothetical protein
MVSITNALWCPSKIHVFSVSYLCMHTYNPNDLDIPPAWKKTYCLFNKQLKEFDIP